MASAALIATVASVGSTAMSAYGSYQDGKAADKAADMAAKRAAEAAEFEAAQLKQQGDAAFAKGTKDAAEERRKAGIVMSNARAAGAASGGATDEGLLETIADVDTEGKYNSMAAMFDAESEQRGYKNKAAAARQKGYRPKTNFKAAGKRKALGTILSGASKAFSS